jgi:large subunit ribosomal protein L21
VERLEAAEGEKVELTDVLLLSDGDQVTVGSSTVTGAKVTAEVISHGRGPKVTVFKYKAKTRHRTKTGHRQPFTRLAIREIATAEKAAEKTAAPKRTRRKVSAEPEEE